MKTTMLAALAALSLAFTQVANAAGPQAAAFNAASASWTQVSWSGQLNPLNGCAVQAEYLPGMTHGYLDLSVQMIMNQSAQVMIGNEPVTGHFDTNGNLTITEAGYTLQFVHNPNGIVLATLADRADHIIAAGVMHPGNAGGSGNATAS